MCSATGSTHLEWTEKDRGVKFSPLSLREVEPLQHGKYPPLQLDGTGINSAEQTETNAKLSAESIDRAKQLPH